MGKNIVIFSDGTGQVGGKRHNTNVYKLFNMVESRTDKQIVYYDPGVGTDKYGIFGLISGLGFTRNILDCYRFIFENYQALDKIYLFGFSRGAATVRSLSAFIHLFGILPSSRYDLVKKAYSIYTIKDHKRRTTKAKEFISKHNNHWCKVHFLGVWDTVLSLGLPYPIISRVLDAVFPHKFHDLNLSESVKWARHALAIDEIRKPFKPELWNPIPKEDTKEVRMLQVWFCGAHSDIGGGYEQEKESDLSNISLQWMLGEAVGKGLKLHTNGQPYKSFVSSSFSPDGIMHNESKRFPGYLFGQLERTWDINKHKNVFLHESVALRKKGNTNLDSPEYSPWILKIKPHTKISNLNNNE